MANRSFRQAIRNEVLARRDPNLDASRSCKLNQPGPYSDEGLRFKHTESHRYLLKSGHFLKDTAKISNGRTKMSKLFNLLLTTFWIPIILLLPHTRLDHPPHYANHVFFLSLLHLPLTIFSFQLTPPALAILGAASLFGNYFS